MRDRFFSEILNLSSSYLEFFKKGVDSLLSEKSPKDELFEKIISAAGHLNSAGFDPWGLEPVSLVSKVRLFDWLYTSYFRVVTRGIDQLPRGRVMVVANHSGQLPFDAVMIFMALIKAAVPGRIARSMVDYWVPAIPFINSFMNQGGAVVGSPRNCLDLLEGEQCVLVFPEGTRGLGKPYSKRYELQPFGTGFLRLALEAKAPIVPLAVVGAEELYPGAFSISSVGKVLGMPYFPVSPFFPIVGPLAACPFPSRIILRFGSPLYFSGDPDMSEEELAVLMGHIKNEIKKEIAQGRRERRIGLF